MNKEINKEIFFNKLRTEMRRLSDLNIGKDAVDMFLDYLFFDFPDKLEYAEKQAIKDGMRTIKAKHVMDVYSIKWPIKMTREGDIEIDQRILNQMSNRDREKLFTLLEKYGEVVVY